MCDNQDPMHRSVDLHCGELIKRLNDALEKKANNALLKDDVTLSQVKMLAILEWHGEQTLKELEKYFGVSQATAAGIALRLEKKGFIEAFYEADDKRAKHVRLTDKGMKVCMHAKESMGASEHWLLSSLTDEEQKQLQRLLLKVYTSAESD